MPTTPLDTLLSYLPDLVIQHVEDHPDGLQAAALDVVPAGVMFADISGFTAMTERLARKGTVGAEELSRLLNEYFGQLVDLVREHGGDVVKFAGDALTALWPIKEGKDGEGKEGQTGKAALAEATLRAAQCALLAQRQLRNFPAVDGLQLSLKIGLGCGDVLVPYLGGSFGRWEYLITGEPLLQVNAAEGQATPGDIIVSPEAWHLLAGNCRGESMASGHTQLTAVHAPIRPQRAEQPRPAPETREGLKRFVPGAINSRLEAGQAGWLAELRRVTVLFAFLPDISHETPLAEAQEVMLSLQTALYRYEGSVNKISVDNKGAMLVAALGLPPLAHEDDAARGVMAALSMVEVLQKLGRKASIGVTTGQAFCGSMGNSTRREYTMLGDIVNLSARLMQAALKYGDALPVLCDRATYEQAQSRIEFSTLPPISVKGKADPVAIYMPQKERQRTFGTSAIAGMVGRKLERVQLLEHLRFLLDGEGSTVIVEGEAGIGKSQLVADLSKQAREVGILPLIGAGDAVEQSASYFAWRSIFRTLFKLGDSVTTTVAQPQIMIELVKDQSLLQRAPLLNTVLPLSLPDTELTSQMEREVRADNTRELLVYLFEREVAERELLVIIEDAHWLDTASWALLAQLRRELPEMMLVVVTRPMATDRNSIANNSEVPPEYVRLRQEAETTIIQLGPLSAAETAELACQRLGVSGLPEAARTLIWEQSEGHPFFSQEIVYNLRDSGALEVKEKQVRFVAQNGNLRALDFPSTIQGVITSRVDRLPPGPRLALKVASVIGRRFSLPLLQNIFPVVADRAAVPEYLALLTRADIIGRYKEPETYIFKHIITQEVSYQLLPYAQRRQLHRALAEWLEQTYVLDLTPHYPLLAHHWERTLDGRVDHTLASTTIGYMEKAGELSLREGAYDEALDYFEQALKLVARMQAADEGGAADALPSYLSEARRASWLLRMAEAYFGQGDSLRCRALCHEALGLLGEPFPEERPRLMSRLTKLSTEHAWQLMRPVAIKYLPEDELRHLLDKARAYNILAKSYFLSNRPFEAAYAALSGFRLAIQVEPSGELAELYAIMYSVLSRLRLARMADSYAEQAQNIALQLNHLPALAFSLMTIALFKFGKSSWDEIQDLIDWSMRVAEELGDKRTLGDGRSILGYIHTFKGEYAQGVANALDLYDMGVTYDNVEYQAWGLFGQGVHLMRLGQTEEAGLNFEKSLAILRGLDSRMVEAAAMGSMAVVRLRQGDKRAAQSAAKLAGELADTPLPMAVGLFTAFSCMSEVYLTLWEEAAAAESREMWQMQALALQGVEMLARYARFNPEGKPRALMYRGWSDWLLGKKRSARQLWQQALDTAIDLAMPYEQGCAALEIGRHMAHGSPQATQYLRQALTAFRRIGAMVEVGRVRVLLGDERDG